MQSVCRNSECGLVEKLFLILSYSHSLPESIQGPKSPTLAIAIPTIKWWQTSNILDFLLYKANPKPWPFLICTTTTLPVTFSSSYLHLQLLDLAPKEGSHQIHAYRGKVSMLMTRVAIHLTCTDSMPMILRCVLQLRVVCPR